MVFRERLSVFGLGVMQAAAYLLRINLYAAVALPDSEYTPSVADITLIYDVLPVSPIPVEAGGKYSDKWSFPSDYKLTITHMGGSDIAITADDSGAIKCYEYDVDTDTILINSGWGFTITKEGSIIYHGPKNDARSEVCILVPLGWSLAGLALTDDMSVIRSITFPDETWERDLAYDRQVFRILYNTDVEAKLIVQEVTWDTDTLAPAVKTQFVDEHIHRYDLKTYQSYWYMATRVLPDAYKYVPTPVFQGVRRMEMQMSAARVSIDTLKVKYAAESDKFDMYRNPELIP